MKLSVIIPTFNRKDTLQTTLTSLNDQTFRDFEVIVADDGSTDGTDAMVASLKVSYPLIHLWQKNAGRSAARNMGLEKASGEIILFIDDHIVVDKKLIEEHVKFHDRFDVGVVRGRVEFIETASDAPKKTAYFNMKRYKAPSYEQQPFRIFITNNISVKKSALMSVLGFDEDFKEYGLQDAEMGYRLKEAGCKFKINPNAVGYIFGVGWTYEERCKRRRQVGRSSVLFCKKHPAPLNKINLSAHSMTLLIQKIMSAFEEIMPARYLMFYNFATGVKEGFEKYKDDRFRKMHSRFKGDRKSILFVSHLSDLSGAPISLSLLVKNLDKEKYHPIVALPGKGPLTAKLDPSGIAYQCFKDSIFHHIFPSFKIRKMLKERQIDLLYLNTSVTIWAAKAAKLLKIPVITHVREDLRGFSKFVIRSKIRFWSDRIILISNWMTGFMRSPKSFVVHNTVDLRDFAGAKVSTNTKGKTILYIGSLEERKGVKYLIAAFSSIKSAIGNVKLVVVGSPLPGQKRYADDLIKMSGDRDIIFTGPRSDIYDIISSGDLLVLPSLSEPFGRTIIEAMACGKPVVATNVGGIPEIVDDGKTGILVAPKNGKVISDAAVKILSDDRLAASMGAAGKKRVEDKFNIEAQVREIERMIDGTLK